MDPSHVPARGCTASPADLNDTQSRAVVDALPPPDLSNPLFNGVALSELAAAISSKRPTAESRTEFCSPLKSLREENGMPEKVARSSLCFVARRYGAHDGSGSAEHKPGGERAQSAP